MLGGSDLARLTPTLVWAALTGVLVPWLGMRFLVPRLRGPMARNYRGRDVVVGLGMVWGFWVIGLVTFLVGESLLEGGLPGVDAGLDSSLLRTAGVLVAGAFVFGLIDDVFGNGAEKGFRGHLGALVRGRLTTGGLKLLGIGVVSLFGGARVALGDGITPASSVHALAAAATLALSANTLNLFDLRPGRALKVYAALSTCALVALAVGWSRTGDTLTGIGSTVAIALFCLGPLLAVYRFDLAEEAMLGDGGANGLGMLAGAVMVFALPPVGVAVSAVALLSLNVASERVSFSKVIEANPVLRAVDGWGRSKAPDRSGGRGE